MQWMEWLPVVVMALALFVVPYAVIMYRVNRKGYSSAMGNQTIMLENQKESLATLKAMLAVMETISKQLEK